VKKLTKSLGDEGPVGLLMDALPDPIGDRRSNPHRSCLAGGRVGAKAGRPEFERESERGQTGLHP
jgi:hypothetical protein